MILSDRIKTLISLPDLAPANIGRLEIARVVRNFKEGGAPLFRNSETGIDAAMISPFLDIRRGGS